MKQFIWLLVFTAWTGMAQQRMIPHITPVDSSFITTIFVTNHADSSNEYALMIYDTNGVQLRQVSGEVAARQTRPVDVGENAAMALFDGAEQIQVAVSYQAVTGSPVDLSDTSTTSRHWVIRPGDWNLVYDAFAVVNRGPQTSTITIEQRVAGDDSLLASASLEPIAPNAKRLGVINNLFEARDDVYYQVSGDTQLAITALRGDFPSTYIWQNHAEPVYRDESLERLDALLGERWGFFYRVSANVNVTYNFTDVQATGSGWVLNGVDAADGSPVTVTFSEDRYELFDSGAPFDHYFLFRVSGDLIASAACVFRVPTGARPGQGDNCFYVIGGDLDAVKRKKDEPFKPRILP